MKTNCTLQFIRCAGLGFLLNCAGCGTMPVDAEDAGASLNAYRASDELPVTLQRVVVLPLAGDTSRSATVEGIEALEPLIVAELIKTRKFEVIHVTPEETRALTGSARWTGAEVIPQELPDRFQSQYGCDALLFCELTRFRPYPPLAIGWRMKLVDVRTGEILWAGDELFDAGRPSVLRDAQRHYRREQKSQTGRWVVERSPRYFGQYAAAELFATLPNR